MSFVENILHGKSIKRLRLMLDSLRTRDLSLQFNLDGMKGEERKLAEEMNAVINDFREDQMRQEKQYQYFDTLLNTVSAMLISTSIAAEDTGSTAFMLFIPVSEWTIALTGMHSSTVTSCTLNGPKYFKSRTNTAD